MNSEQLPSNLYIHIPFCEKKCPYCSFYTKKGTPLEINKYIDSLCYEIKNRLTPGLTCIETIYFGGGSPNILTPRQLKKICTSIIELSPLSPTAEITIELHPFLITQKYIEDLLAIGFTRFSIGVESLDDSELTLLGRNYSGQKAIDAINTVKKAGANNINLDFIIALPEQSKKSLNETISKAIELKPQHLSCYILIFKENSAFYQQKEKGILTELDEKTIKNLYYSLHDQLEEAGYLHYEIANWAKKGFQCKHNYNFWNGHEYLGFGPSAASFINDTHQTNVSTIKQYLTSPCSNYEKYPCKTSSQKIISKIIRQTRLTNGIETTQFSSKILKKLKEENLILINKKKAISTLKGWLVNDYVVQQLSNNMVKKK
ncbi:MAG: radical SAM family heme chaperone HemW [bacterium]